ncbi:MAG: hypothetical protein KJ058_00525 [Thermoanaerobaculia bacterium]|nr:hypothetical protein [Thermoanaerobaculia bacterium]
MRVELGATVILTDASPALWHIPHPDDRSAVHAQALCRITGLTYIYSGIIRTRRCCPICLQRGPAHLAANDDEAEDDGQPAPRRGRPKGKHRRVTDLQLRALHRAYTEQGLSCRQLGELVYQKLGYKNARSCGNVLGIYFREAGLPLRDRIEAVVAASTRHGLAPKHGPRPGYGTYRRRVLHGQPDQPPCAAHVRGRPCQHRAMHGSSYCHSHDPALQASRNEHLARARARRPLVPWADVHARLAAWLATEPHPATTLSQATGVPHATCCRLLNGRQQHVTRRLAHRLTSPLELEEAA